MPWTAMDMAAVCTMRRNTMLLTLGKSTFNYIDLSTVCHNFLQQNECKDFIECLMGLTL